MTNAVLETMPQPTSRPRAPQSKTPRTRFTRRSGSSPRQQSSGRHQRIFPGPQNPCSNFTVGRTAFGRTFAGIVRGRRTRPRTNSLYPCRFVFLRRTPSQSYSEALQIGRFGCRGAALSHPRFKTRSDSAPPSAFKGPARSEAAASAKERPSPPPSCPVVSFGGYFSKPGEPPEAADRLPSRIPDAVIRA